jgi:hypothetical protein
VRPDDLRFQLVNGHIYVRQSDLVRFLEEGAWDYERQGQFVVAGQLRDTAASIGKIR